MKVVYEAPLFPGPGGGPMHFNGLATGLADEGHEVVHVLPRRTSVDHDRLSGRVVLLPAPGGRVLRQLTYELSRDLLLAWWWVTGRRFDLWMHRQSLVGLGLGLARLVARTVALEINGPMREEVSDNFGSRRIAAFADAAFKWQLRMAHLALPVSPGLARYTRQRNSRIKIAVLPNGATPIPGVASWLDRPQPLLFVGALTPWYVLETVFEALVVLRQRSAAVRLHILGDGIRRAELERHARRLGVDDMVVFRGWVSRDEVSEALQASRVGVIPQRQKHPAVAAVGSPLKLYEYAAAGMRVVSTDIDGVVDSPVHEIVSFYPLDDARACADALWEAVTEPPPRLDHAAWSWQSRARQLVREVGHMGGGLKVGRSGSSGSRHPRI